MSSTPLADLTVRALRDRARDLDIRGRSRMRKADLIEAIEAACEARAAAREVLPAEPVAPPTAPRQAERATGLALAPPPASLPPASLPPSPAASTQAAASTVAPIPQGPPSSIFIDRGAPLPGRYQGQRARVMVRDPHTAYVYWEPEPGPVEPAAGPSRPEWEVFGLDAAGRVLARFTTHDPVRGGYLNLPTGELAEVRMQALGQPAHSLSTRVARDSGLSHWVQALDHQPGERWRRPSGAPARSPARSGVRLHPTATRRGLPSSQEYTR